MSGHSKWATTKHKKAVVDAKRSSCSPSSSRTSRWRRGPAAATPRATRPCTTPSRRPRSQSVPNDNIDRAWKRGSGAEAGGAEYVTIMYEGYGPNGVAVLIECLTDNRNRAASEVRVAMTRNGGSMADPGSVSYLFNRKGVVIVPKGELTEDDVLLAVLEAGAEEVDDLDEAFEIVSEATDLVAVRDRPAGGWDRLRLRRPDVPADGVRRARRGGRAQGVPPDRRARGQRRRAERVGELRRHRRDHGSRRLNRRRRYDERSELCRSRR